MIVIEQKQCPTVCRLTLFNLSVLKPRICERKSMGWSVGGGGGTLPRATGIGGPVKGCTGGGGGGGGGTPFDTAPGASRVGGMGGGTVLGKFGTEVGTGGGGMCGFCIIKRGAVGTGTSDDGCLKAVTGGGGACRIGFFFMAFANYPSQEMTKKFI